MARCYAPTTEHPAWCDRSRCTADPSPQADGYRSGVGGQHQIGWPPANLLRSGQPRATAGPQFGVAAVAGSAAMLRVLDVAEREMGGTASGCP